MGRHLSLSHSTSTLLIYHIKCVLGIFSRVGYLYELLRLIIKKSGAGVEGTRRGRRPRDRSGGTERSISRTRDLVGEVEERTRLRSRQYEVDLQWRKEHRRKEAKGPFLPKYRGARDETDASTVRVKTMS